MITLHVRKGLAIKSDNCRRRVAYDPPIGTVIKFIAEDGNEYPVVACSDSGSGCYDCVFNRSTGHPLSKLFDDMCGPNITYLVCYNRIYKPLDDILEDL